MGIYVREQFVSSADVADIARPRWRSVRDLLKNTNEARRAIDALEQKKLTELESLARQARTGVMIGPDIRFRRTVRDDPQA